MNLPTRSRFGPKKRSATTESPRLPKAAPFSQWPKSFKLLYRFRKTDHAGIGDTIKMLADARATTVLKRGGGPLIKRLAEKYRDKLGPQLYSDFIAFLENRQGCGGCEQRRIRLNAIYPYPPPA